MDQDLYNTYCRKMYNGLCYKENDPNVVHFYFENPGFPSGSFFQMINQFANALLNTKGGILVFGVDPKTLRIKGFTMSREQEDNYKLKLDEAIRNMCPTVSPSLCRLEKTTLKECKKATCIMTIKIAPAPIGEMFMNIDEEVFVIRQRKLFGPLIPQEIKDLVIAKYREEVSFSTGLLSPVRTKETPSL